MTTSNPKEIVAFIHTYAQDGELGSYFNELVNGFLACGIRLHLVITNDLVNNLGATSLRKEVSEEKLIEYINNLNPDFLFTTNHGGITKKISSGISCPILTWMVDRIPFLHHGGGHEDLFAEKDYVITSSRNNVVQLEKIYPVLKGRVHYLPFATNVTDFKKTEGKQDINISFVGTYFYCGQLTHILQTYKDRPEICRNILKLVRRIEENYEIDIHSYISEYELKRVLLDFDIDIYKFKGLLSNAISLNNRIKYLDSVADLGLKLWGTENWTNVNAYSLPLMACFQFNEFIKTRELLVNIYQRSKIALNIPHHQAQDGLPYRIFDIMGSRALLITNYRENSDLYMLFGRDVPIPMYKNTSDLRKLVSYFLKNENERIAIVRHCNALVSEKFSFPDRVQQFFSIFGEHLDVGTQKGELVPVKPHYFTEPTKLQIVATGNWPTHASPIRFPVNHTSGSQRMMAKRYLRYITPAWLGGKIKRHIYSSCIRFIVNHTSGSQRMMAKRYLRYITPAWLREKLKRHIYSS